MNSLQFFLMNELNKERKRKRKEINEMKIKGQ